MTTSVTKQTLSSDGPGGRGPDRSQPPFDDGNIVVAAGNTESGELDIRGLRAMGVTLPATADITGLTGIEIHVASKKGGVYAKLAQEGEFSTDTEKQGVGSSFLYEWNSAKIIYVGTITGSGSIPLSFA